MKKKTSFASYFFGSFSIYGTLVLPMFLTLIGWHLAEEDMYLGSQAAYALSVISLGFIMLYHYMNYEKIKDIL